MDVRTKGTCAGSRDTGSLDPNDIAREIRQLAMDSWQGLRSPNTAVEALTRLKHRFEELLSQTQGARAAEVNKWLQSGLLAIDARLHHHPSAGLLGHSPECNGMTRTSAPRSAALEPRSVGTHSDLNSPEANPPISTGTHGPCSRIRI
jgi:hypothetical protein